ncbi:hypothetical protein BaRGS_00038640 [Batillaria attramentaria]|uniref:XK-related protein n=1 Tax=Batillaria attramentaria TaxID=370345 RepID=A0ABD0J5F1_9CAEN
MVEMMYYGMKSRARHGEGEREEDDERYTEAAEGTVILRAFEGFLEAAPQLCFQLYITFKEKPDDDVAAEQQAASNNNVGDTVHDNGQEPACDTPRKCNNDEQGGHVLSSGNFARNLLNIAVNMPVEDLPPTVEAMLNALLTENSLSPYKIEGRGDSAVVILRLTGGQPPNMARTYRKKPPSQVRRDKKRAEEKRAADTNQAGVSPSSPSPLLMSAPPTASLEQCTSSSVHQLHENNTPCVLDSARENCQTDQQTTQSDMSPARQVVTDQHAEDHFSFSTPTQDDTVTANDSFSDLPDQGYDEEEIRQYVGTLRGVAILSSWASLAVPAVKFRHFAASSVITENEKGKISCKLFYFFWRVCETGGRVLCIALFASTFEYWVFGVVGFHFVVMFVWLVWSDLGDSVASKAIDGVLFGYIMVFYIPFHLRPSRYMYLVYYALFYTENFLMLALWAGMTSDRDAWFYIPAIVTVIVLFLLHIVAQLLYYKCFHPKAGDIKWCMKCDRKTFIQSLKDIYIAE